MKTEVYLGQNKLFVELYLPESETQKTPILFVGGVFDGSWIFRQHAEFLSDSGYPVYAMNLRGQYKSNYKDITTLSYEDYLNDIKEVVQTFQLKEFIVSGYSMGGILAQKFIENNPSVRALILYDPTYSKEIANILRQHQPQNIYLPPVMHFIPSKDIVEEMLDELLSDEEYYKFIEPFKDASASAKVYYKLEIERISVDFNKIKTPILIIAAGKENPAFEQMFKLTNSSLFYFDGYSHGSILVSKFFKPVAESVIEWLNSNSKTGEKKYYNWYQDPTFEKYKTHLYYFTGWEKPVVEIYNHKGRFLTKLEMEKIAKGRTENEFIFRCTFNLKNNNQFLLRYNTKIDTPSPGRFYAPLEKVLYLQDGVFYFDNPETKKPPRYITQRYKCESLNWIFTVHIRLPRNYNENKIYPVAILNDGQNQYKGWGAYGGWHTDATLEFLSGQGRCKDVILVAVESPQRRNEAYLPQPFGKAELYVNFLCDALLPQLRQQFSITTSPELTAIIGASYGANNSVYAGLIRPDVFGLIGSFSYAYLPRCPIRTQMRSKTQLPFKKLFISCGTKWSYDQPNRDDSTPTTKDLINIAKEKGMIERENLLGIVFNGDFHNEVYWRKRIGLCLEFLFSHL